jgi:hypothetical protein
MHDLVVADDAGCDEMYSTWLPALRGRLGRLRLDLLTALAPSTPYSLDFKARRPPLVRPASART